MECSFEMELPGWNYLCDHTRGVTFDQGLWTNFTPDTNQLPFILIRLYHESLCVPGDFYYLVQHNKLQFAQNVLHSTFSRFLTHITSKVRTFLLILATNCFHWGQI